MHSRDLIEQYKTYVQDWRRYFHKHPELSNEEFETTKTLAKELESMGVEVQQSLIHNIRCRRSYACRSRWSPYH